MADQRPAPTEMPANLVHMIGEPDVSQWPSMGLHSEKGNAMSEHPLICGFCAEDYKEEDGDLCECGVPVCSPECMDAHKADECENE